MTSSVVAVWTHRDVLRLLVRRDLTVKYQQSIMGYLWSLIEPLGMALIYYFVFGVLYGDRIGPDHGPAYAMFILSGIFPWMWFNSAIGEATHALTGQSRLITTIKVPREVFPIGRVIGRFAEYLAGLPVLVVAALIFGAPFGWYLLSLPLALILQAALLTGLALLLASTNVLLRDVERLIRLAQRILFYTAPIIYPFEKVKQADMPEWLKMAYQANPLVGIFQLHHAAWYPEEFPSIGLLLATAAGCLIVLLAGWWVFRRLERQVLKEL